MNLQMQFYNFILQRIDIINYKIQMTKKHKEPLNLNVIN